MNIHGRWFSRHSKRKSEIQDVFKAYLDGIENWKPIEQPCQVRMAFFFKRPKKHFKKGKLREDAPATDVIVKRPDIDNCCKLILDALQPDVLANDKYSFVTLFHLACNASNHSSGSILT